MNRTNRTKGLLAALGAVLMVTIMLPVAAPAANAGPAPAAGGAPQSWAYGAEKWANLSVALPNGTYSLHAFFGWHVVLTATNTSATTTALEAQRTVAASLFASFCSPGCSNASALGNLSYRAYEQDTGFSNLTAAATVYENGTATPALGILNASATSRGAVNESFSVSGHHGVSTVSASASLDAKGSSSASVQFTPALGLVPWNAAPNVTWNSSSAFTAMGQWAFSWAASRAGPAGVPATASGGPSGAVNRTGSLSLFGADLGTVTLANGQTVPVIVLAIAGPFDDEEGVILIPHAFDLFGGGPHAWDPHALGAATFATARVDLALDALHHRMQVVAGASAYTRADTSVAAAGGVPVSAGVTAAAHPLAAPAPTTVQAQPESVAQAQQQSNCLVGGCGSSTPSHAAMTGLASVLVIGLLIGLVVAAVAGVTWRQNARGRAAQGLAPSYRQPPTSGMPPAGTSGPVPPQAGPGASGSANPPTPPHL